MISPGFPDLMTFASLGLTAPLIDTLETLGYRTPTPVQGKAIPAVLAGRDLMALVHAREGRRDLGMDAGGVAAGEAAPRGRGHEAEYSPAVRSSRDPFPGEPVHAPAIADPSTRTCV